MIYQTSTGKFLKFTFDPKTQTGTLNDLEYRYRAGLLEFFHNGTEVFSPYSIYQAIYRFQRSIDNQALGVAA